MPRPTEPAPVWSLRGPARELVDAHLDAIEAALLRVGCRRTERTAILADVESQIDDRLRREHAAEPTLDAVRRLVLSLDPPARFAAEAAARNGNGSHAGGPVPAAPPREPFRWPTLPAGSRSITVGLIGLGLTALLGFISGVMTRGHGPPGEFFAVTALVLVLGTVTTIVGLIAIERTTAVPPGTWRRHAAFWIAGYLPITMMAALVLAVSIMITLQVPPLGLLTAGYLAWLIVPPVERIRQRVVHRPKGEAFGWSRLFRRAAAQTARVAESVAEATMAPEPQTPRAGLAAG
jgi:hypothetical protein